MTGPSARPWAPTAVRALTRVEAFSRLILRRPLHPYQAAPAQAIVDSVLAGRGDTFAVLMARQAGKNETAAHVEAFLLNACRRRGGALVKAAPTFRPQAQISMRRLEGLLAASALGPPARESGYILRLGRARALFFSAGEGANVVGATADILLEGDEAQAIDEAKWNRDFRPMAASTNATTVLWGTAWTSRTLLARAIRTLREQEARDGRQRVFLVPWTAVAAVVPAYGRYVSGEIARLGAGHPLIRSQYGLEEIDEDGRLFPAATRALMRGSHDRQRAPTEGRDYALLVDVGGEVDPAALAGSADGAALREAEPRRDATALTVVEITRSLARAGRLPGGRPLPLDGRGAPGSRRRHRPPGRPVGGAAGGGGRHRPGRRAGGAPGPRPRGARRAVRVHGALQERARLGLPGPLWHGALPGPSPGRQPGAGPVLAGGRGRRVPRAGRPGAADALGRGRSRGAR